MTEGRAATQYYTAHNTSNNYSHGSQLQQQLRSELSLSTPREGGTARTIGADNGNIYIDTPPPSPSTLTIKGEKEYEQTNQQL